MPTISQKRMEQKNAAKRFAEKCYLARNRTEIPLEAYQACLRIVDHYQVKRPSIKGDNLEPALNRMCCHRWWYRRIQILRLRKIETISRNIELVSRLRGTYASDYTIHVKRKQKEKNRLYLASTFLGRENGDIFSLQNLADRSVSNPVIRRAELMVRIRGFEMVADHLGYVGEFYTLTTPSRKHARKHTWGIRQFQQTGGPSVTVWRQLRKLDKTDDPELEAIRQSATASDWAAFMLAMGDPEISHRSQAIKPYYEHSQQLNPVNGEAIPILTGRYGDPVPLRVSGIIWKGKSLNTRKHVWMLFKVNSEDVTLRSEAHAMSRRSCFSWKDDQPIRKNVWTPALKRAGIEYRNPYQTRHTFASTLLSRGENPLWVAQQMGHKDWGQIIKIYGQWIPPSK